MQLPNRFAESVLRSFKVGCNSCAPVCPTRLALVLSQTSSAGQSGGTEAVAQPSREDLCSGLRTRSARFVTGDCRHFKLMGAQASTEASSSESNLPTSKGKDHTGLRAFKKNAPQGSWTECTSANRNYNFVDLSAEAASTKPEWHLEIGSAMDVLVEEYPCVYESDNRLELAAGDTTYRLEFRDSAMLQNFKEKYSKSLFENMFGLKDTPANRKKVYEEDNVLTAGAESAEASNEWASDLNEQPADKEMQKDRRIGGKGKEVHGLRLGATDRSYLVRDKQIEVLKNVYGGVENTNITFDTKAPNGKFITPSKIILMDGERKMNMLSPEGGTSMFHTDIDTGSIVSEWTFQKDGVDIGMNDLSNETRGAQLEGRDTFLTIGRNWLMQWDTRDPRGAVQALAGPSVAHYNGGHMYSNKETFSCMATSGQGYVVTGSDDGKIRLYNVEKSWKQAKTTIPGVGSPISAVDVTFDGKWVLATAKSQLVVVKTTYKDKDREASGFESKMGSKGSARLLKLKPEDQALLKGEPFRQGKFTWVTDSGRYERWIAASCGNYTVLWNFRKVKLAEPKTCYVSYGGLTTCTDYRLIKKQESVVDSAFMHDNFAHSTADSSMVVATKHQVWSLAD